MRARSLLAATLCSTALLASPALADPSRPAVPAGLTQSAADAHFVLHYGSDVADSYAAAGLADLEEAYSREVDGAGGTPNAHLRVPVADDDARTDVYLAAPTDQPSFHGGQVRRDTGAPFASYM